MPVIVNFALEIHVGLPAGSRGNENNTCKYLGLLKLWCWAFRCQKNCYLFIVKLHALRLRAHLLLKFTFNANFSNLCFCAYHLFLSSWEDLELCCNTKEISSLCVLCVFKDLQIMIRQFISRYEVEINKFSNFLLFSQKNPQTKQNQIKTNTKKTPDYYAIME